ncbi:MAG: hypothetical protein F6K62_18920 [Sphaerospermopsis sp. SIO1G2]|nr:hypothetical protein [Sphaerospermopsis sp. SIO1G2]
MPKRFNNLRAALTFLRTPGADPNAPIPDAPAGTVLAKFQNYEKGGSVEYTRDPSSLPGSLLTVSVKPFGDLEADAPTAKVFLSTRSNGAFQASGLSKTVLGIPEQVGDAIDITGFVPAKAIVRVTTGTTATPKTSQITGLRYNSKDSDSYTFPFGQTSANNSSKKQKSAITQAVEAQATRGVSFKPEIY